MRPKPVRPPIALAAYEALAEAYAARVDTKPHNAYYERPATLSLLPDVDGKRLLDAGCGPGAYADRLAQRGASVTALDISPKMVRLAKERLGDRAEVRLADFSQPLDFLQDGSFDIVLSALALDYIEDWLPVFREFHRLLAPHGTLVFSAGHPFGDFMRHHGDDYFRTERVEETWRGFGVPVRIAFYRRPLRALLDPLLEAGFTLERLLEPQPTREFKQADPRDYDELMKKPGFLCIRASKR